MAKKKETTASAVETAGASATEEVVNTATETTETNGEGSTASVHIDTKNVDVDIEKEANGDFEASVKMGKTTVDASKKGDELHVGIDLDSDGWYEIEHTKKSPASTGKRVRVGGALAKILIKKGFAILKSRL